MATIIEHPNAGANCYTNVAFADAFFADRLSWQDVFDWSIVLDANKTKQLIQATGLLELVFWPWRSGVRAVHLHDLKWPVGNIIDPGTGEYLPADAIPTFLQRATSLLAGHLGSADGVAFLNPPTEHEITSFRLTGVMGVSGNLSRDKSVLPLEVKTMIAPHGEIRQETAHGQSSVLTAALELG